MSAKVSFIHCADLHLDSPFSSFGENGLSVQRRKDLKRTFEGIINRVLEQEIDFLLISGDLYEHQYSTRASIGWLNGQFTRLDDKPVVIIPGNHDPNVSNSWYQTYPWNDNVHILTSQKPDLLLPHKQVYFYGIGFDSFLQEQLPHQKAPQVQSDWINVCLFHGTLNMDFTNHAYNPITTEQLAQMGFDYYALGHFHKRSDEYSSLGMLNPGSPEPLGLDETDEHGVYSVTIEKQNGQAKRSYSFVKMQQRQYFRLSCSVDDIHSDEEVYQKLYAMLAEVEADKNIVSIALTGKCSSDMSFDMAELEQRLKAHCFAVMLTDNTSAGFDFTQLAEETNITGIFVRMMLERIAKAEDDEKKVLEKALQLGLEALLNGEVKP